MSNLDEELALAAEAVAPSLPQSPAARPSGSAQPRPSPERSSGATARSGEGEPSVAPSRAGTNTRRPRQIGLLILLLALVGGTLALFFFGFKAGSVYAMPVDEFVARQGELSGRRVRIDGELVVGSLLKQQSPCEYRFQLTPKAEPDGPKIEVRFPQCVVPQNFQDRPEGGVEVTAEGKMHPDGYFEATTILAKCSSRYDPASRTMREP